MVDEDPRFMYYTYVRVWTYKCGVHIFTLVKVKGLLVGWWVSLTMGLNANSKTCSIQSVTHTTRTKMIDPCNGQQHQHGKKIKK